MFARIQELESELSAVKADLSTYTDLANRYKLEVQQTRDDMLVQEIHMNMAEKKAQKLQEENETLVKRWMQRAAAEAEKMNDANEFLQRYVFYLYMQNNVLYSN